MQQLPDLILHNGRITTLDPKYPEAASLAIKDGRILAVDDAERLSTRSGRRRSLTSKAGASCPA